MSEEIFARRIAGRRVTLKCKHCGTMMAVDGTAGNQGGELRTLPAKTTPATASAPSSSSPTAAPAIAKPDDMSAPLAPGPASPPARRIAAPAPSPSQPLVATPAPVPAQRVAATSAQVPAPAPPRPTSTSRMVAVSAAAPAPAAEPSTAPVRNLTPAGVRVELKTPPAPATVRRLLPPPVPARAPKRDDIHALPPAAPLPSKSDAQDDAAKSLAKEASPAAPEAPARAAPEIEPETAAVAAQSLPVATASAPSAVPVAVPSLQLAPDAEALPLSNARHELGAERELTPGGFAVPSAATASPSLPEALPPPPVVRPPRSNPRRAGRTFAVIAAAVACAGIAALVATKKISLPAPTHSIAKTTAENAKREHAAPALALATTTETTANRPPTPAAPAAQGLAAVVPPVSDPAPSPPSVPVDTQLPAPDAPTTSASASASARDGGEQDIPSYAPAPALLRSTEAAMHRALDCHRGGRAVGSAEVFITFTPNGRVSEARIEGEPIASAPVARCIKEQALAILIPKFDGAPFTITRTLVLR